MSGRRLRDEETALWRLVQRTVVPLHPRLAPPPEPPPPPPPLPEPVAPAPAAKPAARRRSPPPAGDVDAQTRRKIARGSLAIDGRIDLHGMTQDEAYTALMRFIEASVAMRRRVVLVITGKGGEGDGRGVLRRSVPHWLVAGGVARAIVAFGPAGASHGGDGALYVRLRRR